MVSEQPRPPDLQSPCSWVNSLMRVQHSSCHFVSGLNQQRYLPCGRTDKSINRFGPPWLYGQTQKYIAARPFRCSYLGPKERICSVLVTVCILCVDASAADAFFIQLIAKPDDCQCLIIWLVSWLALNHAHAHAHAQSQPQSLYLSQYGSQFLLWHDLSLFAFMQRLIR